MHTTHHLTTMRVGNESRLPFSEQMVSASSIRWIALCGAVLIGCMTYYGLRDDRADQALAGEKAVATSLTATGSLADGNAWGMVGTSKRSLEGLFERFPTLRQLLPTDRASAFVVGTEERCGAQVPGVISSDEPMPPEGLNEAERQAWLAMAHRNSQETGAFHQFYPTTFADGIAIQSGGLKVWSLPATASKATLEQDHGLLMYPEAYPHTTAVYQVGARRGEEFLLLDDESAPKRFDFSLSSPQGTLKLSPEAGGGLLVSDGADHRLRIDPPWVIDATGRKDQRAVHWEVQADPACSAQRLSLVLDPTGLTYPLVIDPSWSATGSMIIGRSLMTATLLRTGKVLVAGGLLAGGTTATAACELYDPVTGGWSATGFMLSPLSEHRANLLQSGKVLVSGGNVHVPGLNGVANTCELYDPTTGTWSATGTMANARYGHVAVTLVATGSWDTVVVSGGHAFSGMLATSERYDTRTGLWTTVGSMTASRYCPSAVLLSSGKVLIAGGIPSWGPYNSSAEVFDPATATWTTTGSMNAPRYNFGLNVLPSGKVLASGGHDTASTILKSCDLFDPGTGIWSVTGSMASPHASHASILLPSGRILVAGGADTTSPITGSCETFDPATGTWSTTASLIAPRSSHIALLLPTNCVLIAGGTSSLTWDTMITQCELFTEGTVPPPPPTFIKLTYPRNGAIFASPIVGFLCQADYSTINLAGRTIAKIVYTTMADSVIATCTQPPYTTSYTPGLGLNFGVNAAVYLSDGTIYSTQSPSYVSLLNSLVQIADPVNGQVLPAPGTENFRVYVSDDLQASSVYVSIIGNPTSNAATQETDLFGTPSWTYAMSGIAAGSYTVQAQADNASTFTNSPTVNFSVAYTAPTLVMSAYPSVFIQGKIATISSGVTDSSDPAPLTLAWTVSGPGSVSLDSTTSKFVQATFTQAGSYTFTCTATNQNHVSSSQSLNVSVFQTLSSINVTAAAASTNIINQQFNATALDQFGVAMSPAPTISWSVNGGGTISASGLFTSTGSQTTNAGPFVVSATSGSVSGVASVRTGSILVSVCAPSLICNGSTVTEVVTINGSATSYPVTLTNATFANGSNSTSQAGGTTATYVIIPSSGAAAVSLNVAGAFVTPREMGNHVITIDNIYRGNYPSGASLPFGISCPHSQVYNVQINPPFPPGYFVNLMVVKNSVEKPGAVCGEAEVTVGMLQGGAGGQFTLKGITMTDPGQNLKVVAISRSLSQIVGQNQPFTVCCHPDTFKITGWRFIGKVKYEYWGVKSYETILNDSDLHDTKRLYYSVFMESMEQGFANSVFPPGNLFVQTTYLYCSSPFVDTLGCMENSVQRGLSGEDNNYQVYHYNCKTCGMTSDCPVAHSAFLHYRYSAPTSPSYGVTEQTLDTHKTPDAYPANNWVAAPGVNKIIPSTVQTLPHEP